MFELVQYPLAIFAQHVGQRFANEFRFRCGPYACSGGVAGYDYVVGVKREDAVRHALQHAFIVVFHPLHIIEKLRVFERNRDLRGKRLQALLILVGEATAFLVEHLRHADRAIFLVDDGNAQDRSCEEAGLPVEGRVEPQVCIGMRNVHCLASGENGTSDTEVCRKANFRDIAAGAHP